MGVVMRPSKTSVAGKLFGYRNVPSRFFPRRGRENLGLNTAFLLILALTTLVSRNLWKYMSSHQNMSTLSSNTFVPIDFNKGDIDGGFPPLIDKTVGNDPNSLDGNIVELYLDEGAKFSASSLEKGNPATLYDREGYGSGAKEKPRPIPLPPADAPVRFPLLVNGGSEDKKVKDQQRRVTLLKRKPRKQGKNRAWKRRRVTKELALEYESGISTKSSKRNSFPYVQGSEELKLTALSGLTPGRNKSGRSNVEKETLSVWNTPLQPIQDPTRYLTLSDLERQFGILAANLSVLSAKTLRLISNYDIRNDAEFHHLAIHGNLSHMDAQYAPIARRGWGSVLGGAPSSIPSDHLYHVRHSGDTNKGYGMYASVNLPPETVLGTYGGELLLLSQISVGQYAWGAPDMVLQDPTTGMRRNTSMVLDASKIGNFLRFVNDLGPGKHNVEPIWVPVDNRWTLFYKTTRAVVAGEELSVPYGEEYWGKPETANGTELSSVATTGKVPQKTLISRGEPQKFIKRYLKSEIEDEASFPLKHNRDPILHEERGSSASQYDGFRKIALRKIYLSRREEVHPLQ